MAFQPPRPTTIALAAALAICTTLFFIIAGVLWGSEKGGTSQSISERTGDRHVLAGLTESTLRSGIRFSTFTDPPPHTRESETALPYWSLARNWLGSVQGQDPPSAVNIELAYGWPMRAASGLLKETPGPNSAPGTMSAQIGVLLPDRFESYGIGTIRVERVIPFRPIWPGLIINTLVFAALLLLVFQFAHAIRRRSRARRNLCPTCKYDLHATPPCSPCPECGTPRP